MSLNEDEIEITILDDGSLKIDTDAISMPNHVSAESVLRMIADKCGTTPSITQKKKSHKHAHKHKTKAEQ